MKTEANLSDMFACRTCATQIQVMQACDCESACAEFTCCGEPMNNITEPPVRQAGDQNPDDGLEIKAEDG